MVCCSICLLIAAGPLSDQRDMIERVDHHEFQQRERQKLVCASLIALNLVKNWIGAEAGNGSVVVRCSRNEAVGWGRCLWLLRWVAGLLGKGDGF